MIGYRNSSNTGNDTSTTNRAPAVPAGSQSGDVVVVFLSRWDPAINPAVTAPSGFVRQFQVTSGDGGSKIDVFWKRLTAADTGTYTFSWSGSMWSSAEAIGFTGVKSSGDPIGANWNAWKGTAGTFGSTSLTTSFIPGLAWNCYNDSAGTHSPPTGFTETADADCGSLAYLLPGASGTRTASGASVTSSSSSAAVLVALEPEPVAAGGPEPGRFLIAV